MTTDLDSLLLDLLSDGGFVSRTHLTDSLSISPSELERRLLDLESEGCSIRRRGSRLSLDCANGFGQAVISWRLGRKIHFFDSLGSTNSKAWELAGDGAGAGTLVVADSQTGGRGRMGRSWWSPPGTNLYFSLLLRPDITPHQAPLLGLSAAYSMAELLDLQVKWPNDLVTAHGKKLCGFLAEMELDGGQVAFVILGVGLNVNQTVFPQDLPLATSLRNERGHLHDRASLLARIVLGVESGLRRHRHDSAALMEGLRQRSHTLGRHVKISLGSPASTGEQGSFVEGLAVDIRTDGALVLQLDDGTTRLVRAGDVETTSSRIHS